MYYLGSFDAVLVEMDNQLGSQILNKLAQIANVSMFRFSLPYVFLLF